MKNAKNINVNPCHAADPQVRRVCLGALERPGGIPVLNITRALKLQIRRARGPALTIAMTLTYS